MEYPVRDRAGYDGTPTIAIYTPLLYTHFFPFGWVKGIIQQKGNKSSFLASVG
jgi:hypothetical protein